MTIKKFFYATKILINLLYSKKIYLINSPQNYISLIEYLNEKNIDNKKTKIFIGFTSQNSVKQILKIHKSEIGIKNKLIFLQKIFDERKRKILFLVLQVLKVSKSFCIVGDKKSFLFKLLYQGSKKTVFLDDGLNLLTFKDSDIKVKEYELFSYFDLKTKKLVKNRFTYLRKKTLINNVNNNHIWLLGTPAANFEIIDNEDYKKIINLFAKKFKNKKIFFFPHRDEVVDNTFFLKNIVIKKNITEPIEIYTSKQKTMPFLIAGFYSTALHILNMILREKKITLMNINFDTNFVKTANLKKLYNLENLKKQYNLVKVILKKNNIKNFF